MASSKSSRVNLLGFTLIELLVVIAIIALLMSILMPTLARVKKQAQAVACQSYLKQWGTIYVMYTDDNNGKFLGGYHQGNHVAQWHKALKKLYQDKMINFCPVAIRNRMEKAAGTAGSATWSNIAGGTFYAWGQDSGDSFSGGSYGENGWATNPPDEYASAADKPLFWRTPHVSGANNIPLLADSMWLDGWSRDADGPPQFFDDMTSSMTRHCINRHQGGTNAVFLDWSVRKIGCKELWTLKWHRSSTRQASTPAPAA